MSVVAGILLEGEDFLKALRGGEPSSQRHVSVNEGTKLLLQVSSSFSGF